MTEIFISLLGGIALGLAAGVRLMRLAAQAATPITWVLLFAIGLEIGTDDALFESLGSIWLRSAAIGLSAAIGSAAAAGLLWRKTNRRKI